MIYRTRKRIAARLLKRSIKRVKLDPAQLEDIKEALTKADIRGLIKDGAIRGVPKKGVSRGMARKKHLKKRKGQLRGHGRRKGKATARTPAKRAWMNRVRLQRRVLRELRESKRIDPATYRQLYLKSKGGFFRSRRHLNIYISEHKLVKQDDKNA